MSYKNSLMAALTCSFAIDIRIVGIIIPIIVLTFFFLESLENKIFYKNIKFQDGGTCDSAYLRTRVRKTELAAWEFLGREVGVFVHFVWNVFLL